MQITVAFDTRDPDQLEELAALIKYHQIQLEESRVPSRTYQEAWSALSHRIRDFVVSVYSSGSARDWTTWERVGEIMKIPYEEFRPGLGGLAKSEKHHQIKILDRRKVGQNPTEIRLNPGMSAFLDHYLPK
jgi:hypothetical protein